MAYDFTRARKCENCGKNVKADRAVKKVLCPQCFVYLAIKRDPTVQASEPEGESK